jgi:hypothetical protein
MPMMSYQCQDAEATTIPACRVSRLRRILRCVLMSCNCAANASCSLAGCSERGATFARPSKGLRRWVLVTGEGWRLIKLQYLASGHKLDLTLLHHRE